ncbi:hypothetical protein TRFO_21470 [Tritrichomonas foetus]|uniref:BTB domain-containing protein n=1 Tax=Tritrichomonas foetus TaxID=1144522 RepID=A0A1J4KEG1_9EUKA|nr:hypothetical protein TRFO_21470 [Tritrichomonas foetus]|eukprot:OHT09587.1 hypothetical protein TRFO_21470 [Tritrichomonas foetus]
MTDSYVIIYNHVEFSVDPDLFSKSSNVFANYYNPEQSMKIQSQTPISSFEKLLPFVQGKNPQITHESVDELTLLAEEWEVSSLLTKIDEFNKKNNVDEILTQFLDKIHSRVPVKDMIPTMAENINVLLNKTQFLLVPPHFLSQILQNKKCNVRDHHELYRFILSFINLQKEPKSNCYNLMNFLDPKRLSEEEIEDFFTVDMLPKDSGSLSQMPTLLTNLTLFFREKFRSEHDRLNAIEGKVKKQKILLDQKKEEISHLKAQLAELQRSSRQKPNKDNRTNNNSANAGNKKKGKNRDPMVYYPPSNDNKNNNASNNYNNNKSNSNNKQNMNIKKHPNNINISDVKNKPPTVMLPGGSTSVVLTAPVPMQRPGIQNITPQAPPNTTQPIQSMQSMQGAQNMPNNMGINGMVGMQNISQISGIRNVNNGMTNGMTPGMNIQTIQQIQMMNMQMQLINQQPGAQQPIIQPPVITPPQQQETKKIPQISVEKPKFHTTSLDPEQKAMIAMARKHQSVKIEKPQKKAIIEFGKKDEEAP